MGNSIDRYASTAAAFVDLGMKSSPPEEHANHFHHFFFNKSVWRWVRRHHDTNEMLGFASFYPESGRLVFIAEHHRFDYRADPNAVALIEVLAARFRDTQIDANPGASS